VSEDRPVIPDDIRSAVRLANGPQFVAIPGPSMVPPQVLAAFSRPIPDIYEGELIEVSDELWSTLPAIAGTTDAAQFVTISNGHGAWEMALANTLSPGDHVLVANCGVFAAGWGELAAELGVLVELIDAAPGRAVDPADVYARLHGDTEHEIKAVLVVHVDTASSARNDLAAIRRAIDEADHPALLMVDAIASLGCEEYRMDEWRIDVTVGACQKGLMTPPGLAFVWAGPRALEAHRTARLRSWYWSWTSRLDQSAHYLRYAGTPPVSHLYALREALSMIEAEGLEHAWARHAAIGGAVRAAVEAWSAPGGLSLNVTTPGERANSVTTIRTGDVDAELLRRTCRESFGVTLGVGLRTFAGEAFRIGHMGYVSGASTLGVLGAIEATLTRIGAPLGASSGVGAAARELADTAAGS